ncbi:hypothetical protein ACLB2K_054570 [Fragaria x ananassa]
MPQRNRLHIQGEFWSRTTFATIFVTDLPLVEEPSLYSQSVGQIQGLLVVASKDGRHNYETSSIMFNEYNGSTLVTQGTLERVSGEPSEVAVVGARSSRCVLLRRSFFCLSLENLGSLELRERMEGRGEGSGEVERKKKAERGGVGFRRVWRSRNLGLEMRESSGGESASWLAMVSAGEGEEKIEEASSKENAAAAAGCCEKKETRVA